MFRARLSWILVKPKDLDNLIMNFQRIDDLLLIGVLRLQSAQAEKKRIAHR